MAQTVDEASEIATCFNPHVTIDPKLASFIDAAIVPLLVELYIAEGDLMDQSSAGTDQQYLLDFSSHSEAA